MNDRALVAAMVAGDPDGLARAYRAYADRLYTYCDWLLGNREAAGEALHDTFVLASKHAAELDEPDRLRYWLYAIARNECLRRTGHRLHRRQAPDPESDPDPEPDPDPDPEPGPEPEVTEAATGALTPPEQEVLELATRHGLPAGEIAALLGCSPERAQERVAKARANLEQALAALWIARTAAEPCRGLFSLLDGAGGTLTPRSRRRVRRHLGSCPICTELMDREPHATALLPAYADAPLLTVPPLLWPRLELHAFDPGLDPEREAVVRRAGRFDRGTGFPRPLDRRRQRRRLATAATAVLAALAAAGAGVLMATAGPGAAPDPQPGAAGAASPPPVSAAGDATADPPGAGQAAAPQPTLPTTPTGSPPAPAPPPPSPTDSAAGPPPLTIEAGVEVECVAGGLFGHRLVASVAANQSLTDANLVVSTGVGTQTYPLTVDGSAASGESDLLFGDEVTWFVEVASSGGDAAATGPEEISEPC